LNESTAFPRPATKKDVPQMAQAMVKAFAREPFHQWMVPDAEAWSKKAPKYFNSYIKLIRRDGYADTVDGGHGAALWLSPEKPGGGMLSRFQVPFVLWRLAGQKFTDVMSVIPLIERHRPQDPHWYLDVLGVDPAYGRTDVGSALLKHGLERCDRSGQSVFLDTLSESNVRLYEKHGFEVTAQFSLPSNLPIWTMVRQPSSAP
jgi:ribosomal protein S18 acetylase RimI-like enzyme